MISKFKNRCHPSSFSCCCCSFWWTILLLLCCTLQDSSILITSAFIIGQATTTTTTSHDRRLIVCDTETRTTWSSTNHGTFRLFGRTQKPMLAYQHQQRRRSSSRGQVVQLSMAAAGAAGPALGEFTINLDKPLGMILEEQEAGGGTGGVRIKSLVDEGSAVESGIIAPGDILLSVNDQDVSNADFDSVMELLIEAPSTEPVKLTISDGLGRMDIAPALARQLRRNDKSGTGSDAMLVDSVVRAAVRSIRQSQRLGDLLNVEIIIGAGIRDNGKTCLVRFFAIFSTDGVTTYSCNVSATGLIVQRTLEETSTSMNTIEIVDLSCAKDEGLGQTVDLKRRDTTTSST